MPAMAVPRGSSGGYISHERPGLDAARPADGLRAVPGGWEWQAKARPEVLATAGGA
jgi:hypothetical protein